MLEHSFKSGYPKWENFLYDISNVFSGVTLVYVKRSQVTSKTVLALGWSPSIKSLVNPMVHVRLHL